MDVSFRALRALAAGAVLWSLAGCGDEIFAVYTDDPAPIAMAWRDRVELRSRAAFGVEAGLVTLDGRKLTVTSWTPDVILARVGAEDRSGRLVVETADGRRIQGPRLKLGQGTDTALDAWGRHVEEYAARYGYGKKWIAFMKGEFEQFQAAFQRQELERIGDEKTLTLAYHYWQERRHSYRRPWPGATEAEQESAHMKALEKYLSSIYAGWTVRLTYLGKPEDHDATIYADWPSDGQAKGYIQGGFSPLLGRTDFVLLTSEIDGPIGHEVGHRLGLNHHDGKHLPPGEILCIMNNNYAGLCSACRCALDIDRTKYSIWKIWAAWIEKESRY